jgi:DNA-binding GntR family transcriptional regulator
VQRRILEELDERVVADDPWADVGAIAERLGHTRRSVRRALRLLAADGHVEIDADHGHVRARIAVSRLDEVAIRRARRTKARALRRDLGVSLLSGPTGH